MGIVEGVKVGSKTIKVVPQKLNDYAYFEPIEKVIEYWISNFSAQEINMIIILLIFSVLLFFINFWIKECGKRLGLVIIYFFVFKCPFVQKRHRLCECVRPQSGKNERQSKTDDGIRQPHHQLPGNCLQLGQSTPRYGQSCQGNSFVTL